MDKILVVVTRVTSSSGDKETESIIPQWNFSSSATSSTSLILRIYQILETGRNGIWNIGDDDGRVGEEREGETDGMMTVGQSDGRLVTFVVPLHH